MQATHDYFQSRWQEPCEEAMRVAQDAHHQVLVAATLLEGHIERTGCSFSCGWSNSQGQSSSHQCSHSRRCTMSFRRCPPAGQQEQVPSAADNTGDSGKRQAPSPSPAKLRRQVTFKEHSSGWIPQCGRFPPWPGLRRHPTGASWQKGIFGPCPILTPISNTSWEVCQSTID